MTRKQLPWLPETDVALQSRFAAALAEPLDFEAMYLGSALTPFEMRRHIFDIDHGLRLVVARYSVRRPGDSVWVSAGFFPGTRLEQTTRTGRIDGRAFRAAAIELLEHISGRPWTLRERSGSGRDCLWVGPWRDCTWTGARRRRRPRPLRGRPHLAPGAATGGTDR